MKTWMPMETAPKDRRILVLRVANPATEQCEAAVARWEPQTHHTKPDPYWAVEGGLAIRELRNRPPLGWMPLPPATPTSPFAQQAQIFLCLHAAIELLRQLPSDPAYYAAKEISSLRNAIDMLSEVYL